MAKQKKLFCNTCKTQTNHGLGSLHYRYCQSESDINNFEFIGTTELDEPLDFKGNNVVFKYETWVCRGCDTVTLQESCATRRLTKNNKEKKSFWAYSIYPPRTTENLPEKFLQNTPVKLHFFYYEIVKSFNAELPVLCSIGLRALLEGICKDKGITDKDAWGLTDKINELAKRQHLPLAIAENLKSYKFIGDSAAHYLEAPDKDSLKLGIEIIEDLLNYLYALEYKSEWLYERILDDENVKKKRE